MSGENLKIRALIQESMDKYLNAAVDRLNSIYAPDNKIDWGLVRTKLKEIEAKITAHWNSFEPEKFKTTVDLWEQLFLQARAKAGTCQNTKPVHQYYMCNYRKQPRQVPIEVCEWHEEMHDPVCVESGCKRCAWGKEGGL